MEINIYFLHAELNFYVAYESNETRKKILDINAKSYKDMDKRLTASL
jgi:hypothetical protein